MSNIQKIEEKSIEYQDLAGTTVKINPSIIRKYLVNGNANITNQEAMMFLMLCKNRQLNPFNKEAHLIKYSDNLPATMVVGKDAFTQRAAAHSDFNGIKTGIVIQVDGRMEKREGCMSLLGELIVGGWAEVYRKGWDYPVRAEVSYDEYEGKKSNGETNKTWSKMGATMIRKVALVQALREAFPDQFSGMYDSSEMSQSSNVDVVDKVDSGVINISESDIATTPTDKKQDNNEAPPPLTQKQKDILACYKRLSKLLKKIEKKDKDNIAVTTAQEIINKKMTDLIYITEVGKNLTKLVNGVEYQSTTTRNKV